MTNKFYDVLKRVALYMPATIALVTGLCELYHCPYTTYIVGTMALVNTFLAAVVEISSHSYYKKLQKSDEEWDSMNIEE